MASIRQVIRCKGFALFTADRAGSDPGIVGPCHGRRGAIAALRRARLPANRRRRRIRRRLRPVYEERARSAAVGWWARQHFDRRPWRPGRAAIVTLSRHSG
jgi:hypothetical protein